MQDVSGTRTSVSWRVSALEKHSLFLIWVSAGDATIFNLMWNNGYTKLPIFSWFSSGDNGHLEATEPPAHVAFLLFVYLLPSSLLSSGDVLQTCAVHKFMFHFQPPTLRTKVTGLWVILYLILFSYFQRYTKETNNFNRDVRFTWPGKQYTTQHEQSQ